MAQPHWTQRPENKEKARANAARATAGAIAKAKAKRADAKVKRKHPGPQKHSAAARRKISAAMKASHARRVAAAAANGHVPDRRAPNDIRAPLDAYMLITPNGRLAKQEVRHLAVDGARQKLAALRRQCEILEIFIRKAGD